MAASECRRLGVPDRADDFASSSSSIPSPSEVPFWVDERSYPSWGSSGARSSNSTELPARLSREVVDASLDRASGLVWVKSLHSQSCTGPNEIYLPVIVQVLGFWSLIQHIVAIVALAICRDHGIVPLDLGLGDLDLR